MGADAEWKSLFTAASLVLLGCSATRQEPTEGALPTASAPVSATAAAPPPPRGVFVEDPSEPLPPGALARLGTTRWRGWGIGVIREASDGNAWAIGEFRGRVRLRNLTTRSSKELPGATRYALSPDGAAFAHFTPGGSISVVRTSGEPIATLSAVGAPPLELYLGPAGRHLFVATKATQQIFDTTTKKAVYDSKEPGFVAGVSADGGTLLVAHGDMTTAAENWDRGGYTYVAQEAWSVLDLRGGVAVSKRRSSQGGPSTWFGLSPDGDTVYEHAESSVTLYAAADAKERQRVQLPGLDLPFGGAGIFPHVDGKHIMVSGQAYALDGWKKLDEAAALALDAPPPIHPSIRPSRAHPNTWGQATAIAHKASSDEIIAARSGGVVVHDSGSGEVRQALPGQATIVSLAAKSGALWLYPDLRRVSPDGTVTRFPLAGSVTELDAAPDGERAYAVVDWKGLFALDPSKKTAELIVGGGKEQVFNASLSRDGSRLVVLVKDTKGLVGRLDLLDASTHERVATRSAWPGELAFIADTHVVTRQFAALEVFKLPGLDLEARVPVQQENLASVASSPDGRLLATNWEDRIMLFDRATLAPLGGFDGHLARVRDLTFLDDRRLASASDDGSVLVWDVQKPQPLVLETKTRRLVGVKKLPARNDGCRLLPQGDVVCGEGTKAVTVLRGARSYVAGREVCALDAAGRVRCRGLGSQKPEREISLPETTLALTAGFTTCALGSSGAIHCWSEEGAPEQRGEVQGAKWLAQDDEMVCGLDAAARVSCAGYQVLEDSDWAWLPTLLRVPALDGATAIGFVDGTLCAERAGGVDCATLGLRRAFGDDPYPPPTTKPAP